MCEILYFSIVEKQSRLVLTFYLVFMMMKESYIAIDLKRESTIEKWTKLKLRNYREEWINELFIMIMIIRVITNSPRKNKQEIKKIYEYVNHHPYKIVRTLKKKSTKARE